MGTPLCNGKKCGREEGRSMYTLEAKRSAKKDHTKL